jgi:hypothetical protein
MAFPTSPINGQQALVNGIQYVYVSSKNAWNRQTGTVSVTGGFTVAGNLVVTGDNLQYNANSVLPKSYSDVISVVFGF